MEEVNREKRSTSAPPLTKFRDEPDSDGLGMFEEERQKEIAEEERKEEARKSTEQVGTATEITVSEVSSGDSGTAGNGQEENQE